MTACTNNGGKARRVVTAALVGVLSVGAVPAIALATGADVSLMANDGEEVVQATVKYDGEDGADFSYTGKGQGLVPTSVELVGGGEETPELTPAKADRSDGYYYYYVKLDEPNDFISTGVKYVDENGKPQPVSGKQLVSSSGTFYEPFEVGEYVVVCGYYQEATERWTFVDDAVRFTISGQSLEGATIYQGDDVTDTTFNFTGKLQSLVASNFVTEIGIAVDGDAVDMSYFWANIYESGSSSAVKGSLVPGETYVFAAQGKPGTPYAGKRVEKSFTVEKLDLSDSVIVGKATDDAQPSSSSKFADVIDTFNGLDLSEIANCVSGGETTLKFVSGPEGTGTTVGNKKGEYTFKLVANDDAKYIKPGSSTQFTVLYGDAEAAVTYDNKTFEPSYDVDLSEDESFDLSKIAVKAGSKTLKAGEDYAVTVKNAAGDTVEDLSAPGTYTVDVLVSWKDENGKLFVAHKTAEVTVGYGQLTEATDVFMFFDGKNVEDKGFDGATFTGEDLSEKLTFVVKAGDKTLAEGTDYTVKIEQRQSDGKWAEVDSIVDAGDYRVTVEGITYDIKGQSTKDVTFEFVVKPMPVVSAKVNADVEGADAYLAYTGEVLTPSFTFYTKDSNGKLVEVEVPEGSFEVTYDLMKLEQTKEDPAVYEYVVDKKDVELKDKGVYQARFDTADDVENYEFTAKTGTFEVTDKQVFLDVPMNEWYSQGVYDAAANGYMNGDGGKKTFSPMRELTRAEAACVLFNMAGGNNAYADGSIPGYIPNGAVYETGFSDVAGNEFYAKAIAWAKTTGVINGYADGTFGVSRKVTNEEFACMLANYAKAKGEFEAVDADAVLAAYPDADVVSDWAEDAVAWCVSEGIMGGGANISPAGSILRMRAATMAVNAQPEKAGSALIPIV